MKLILLIGNIAAGKSTCSRKYAERGAIIVNDDAVIQAVHGDYRLYSEDLKPLYKIVENTILTTALAMNRDVVVDRPNHTISMRQRHLAIARSLDVPVDFIVFPWSDPSIHATRRVNHDARGYSYEYWLEVARKFNDAYEMPDSGEKYRSVNYWKFDDENN